MPIEILWRVSALEATQILNALAERPFKEVNALISKLHSEASQQVKEQEKAGSDGNSNRRE